MVVVAEVELIITTIGTTIQRVAAKVAKAEEEREALLVSAAVIDSQEPMVKMVWAAVAVALIQSRLLPVLAVLVL